MNKINLKAKRKQTINSMMKEHILETAVEFLKQTKNINNFTMDNIAKFADIAKGTLYIYFKNKDDLLKELIQKLKKQSIQQFQKIKNENITVSDKFKKIFQYMLEDIEKNINFIRLLLQSIDCNENLKRDLHKDDELIINIFSDILKQALKNKEIKIENPDYAAKMIFACLVYLVRERGEGLREYMSITNEVKSFIKLFNFIAIKSTKNKNSNIKKERSK
ncbi:MAG TPA: TetR/AcrR family transcriptional regulator [bacterium]|nr:TetR/AcrR family transcriptional regulator [bacterium]